MTRARMKIPKAGISLPVSNEDTPGRLRQWLAQLLRWLRLGFRPYVEIGSQSNYATLQVVDALTGTAMKGTWWIWVAGDTVDEQMGSTSLPQLNMPSQIGQFRGVVDFRESLGAPQWLSVIMETNSDGKASMYFSSWPSSRWRISAGVICQVNKLMIFLK